MKVMEEGRNEGGGRGWVRRMIPCVVADKIAISVSK